jgi:hypothetical protein
MATYQPVKALCDVAAIGKHVIGSVYNKLRDLATEW